MQSQNNNAIYITTPIYYVNSKPHIGHAYTTIVCDVLARLHKMLGSNVKFVTGTDEHGKKVEQSAINAGKTPQQFTDEISQLFRDLLTTINASNDDFIRTTDSRHKKAVAYFWKQLKKSGHIYLGEYSGWYDIRNEAYFNDDELIDGKSPLGGEVTMMKEPCYFFKLSAFQDKLLRYYEQYPNFVYPASRRNEVISFVKSGLKDLAVSRTTFSWGIPVPNDEQHIIYVWLDALVNYITLNGYPENDKLDDEYWKNVVHFTGKEIVRFHAVYWPAFLMAANLPLPKQIVSHGWWVSNGEKMSKSIGNVQNPSKYCDLFGSDALRYFMLREIAFGDDGNFALDNFISRYNSFLANSYGNMCQRVLSFIYNRLRGAINQIDLDAEYKAQTNEIEQIIYKAYGLAKQYQFNKYLEKIEHATSLVNQFIDLKKPWAIKDNDTLLNKVLCSLLTSIVTITKALSPVIPIAASKLLSFIKIDNNTIHVSQPEILFHKIDPEQKFDVHG